MAQHHRAARRRRGAGDRIGSPFSATATVVGFFADHGFAARFAAMLQLGSAIPLGICAAIMHTRLRNLGVTVPGPTIGLFGGVAAALLLIVSGCLTWTQGQAVLSTLPGLVHALSFVAFATGGFAHVAGLGLLIAGIAVPGYRLGLLPGWLCLTGLVIAALAELSILTMVTEAAQYLIPIGRFTGLIWLTTAGFLLPPNPRPATHSGRSSMSGPTPSPPS